MLLLLLSLWLLLLLLLVVGCWLLVVVVVAAQLIFAFLSIPKNRQIGCVFVFFYTPGAKHIVNTNAFCTSEAHNHGIYDIFAAGSKNHGITMFLASA